MENKEEIIPPLGEETLENAVGGVCVPSDWEAYCTTCKAFLPPKSASDDICPVCGNRLIYPRG